MNTVVERETEDDWWDKLPGKVQIEIDEALADLDKNNGIPHEIVVNQYAKWFTHNKE